MLIQILENTPKWVFALFAGLLWLGLSQMRTRQVSLRRIGLQGLGLTGFSLYGMLSAFPDQPLALLVWLAAAAATFATVLRRGVPAGTRHDPATDRFTLPGSTLPLVLIMSLFLVKYAVGVSLALNHALAQDLVFALACGGAYGAFSGAFAGPAARLWRIAGVQHNAPANTTPVAPVQTLA